MVEDIYIITEKKEQNGWRFFVKIDIDRNRELFYKLKKVGEKGLPIDSSIKIRANNNEPGEGVFLGEPSTYRHISMRKIIIFQLDLFDFINQLPPDCFATGTRFLYGFC